MSSSSSSLRPPTHYYFDEYFCHNLPHGNITNFACAPSHSLAPYRTVRIPKGKLPWGGGQVCANNPSGTYFFGVDVNQRQVNYRCSSNLHSNRCTFCLCDSSRRLGVGVLPISYFNPIEMEPQKCGIAIKKYLNDVALITGQPAPSFCNVGVSPVHALSSLYCGEIPKKLPAPLVCAYCVCGPSGATPVNRLPNERVFTAEDCFASVNQYLGSSSDNLCWSGLITRVTADNNAILCSCTQVNSICGGGIKASSGTLGYFGFWHDSCGPYPCGGYPKHPFHRDPFTGRVQKATPIDIYRGLAPCNPGRRKSVMYDGLYKVGYCYPGSPCAVGGGNRQRYIGLIGYNGYYDTLNPSSSSAFQHHPLSNRAPHATLATDTCYTAANGDNCAIGILHPDDIRTIHHYNTIPYYPFLPPGVRWNGAYRCCSSSVGCDPAYNMYALQYQPQHPCGSLRSDLTTRYGGCCPEPSCGCAGTAWCDCHTCNPPPPGEGDCYTCDTMGGCNPIYCFKQASCDYNHPPPPPTLPPTFPPPPPSPPIAVRGLIAEICTANAGGSGIPGLSGERMFVPWSPTYAGTVFGPQFWLLENGPSRVCVATLGTSSSAASNQWGIADLQGGTYQDCQACISAQFGPLTGGNP